MSHNDGRKLLLLQKMLGHASAAQTLDYIGITSEEIEEACRLSKEGGAKFVKTSTGFNSGGAKTEDVALMKKTVGDALQVKASGGIRDYDTAMAMIEAGADRIGASASVKIMEVYENVKQSC